MNLIEAPAGSADAARLSMARTVARATATLGRRWPLLVAVALLFEAPASLLTSFATGDLPVGMSPAAMAELSKLAWFLSAVVSAVADGALLQAVLHDQRGRKLSAADTLAAGFSFMVPMVMLSLVTIVTGAVGLILLVAPGFMLLAMWAIGDSVLVAEGTGVFAALRRSRELTRGSRWPIFGLWGIAILLGLGVQLGLVAIATPVDGPSWPSLMLEATASTASIAFALLSATVYAELSQLRQGVDAEDLAEVFA